MRRAFTTAAIALLGGILLGIMLIVLGVSKLPMLIVTEVTFVTLFSVFYWKPTVIRDIYRLITGKIGIRS